MAISKLPALQIGDYNDLIVERILDFGAYLSSADGDVLIPRKYLPADVEPGDMLRVFVYRDSEDRIIATTLKPKVLVNHFAVLEVKDATEKGAFLDWGLEKDLFVPFREQSTRMQAGDWHLVYVLMDETTDRLVATAKIGKYLGQNPQELRSGDTVSLLVTGRGDLGYRVLVEEKYLGMLYYNEVFRPVELGARLKGYVKQVRPDGRIDVSLQQAGMNEVESAKAAILEEVRLNNGTLKLSDSSSPEDIKRQLNMSKKTFKKAIGGMLKDGLIEIFPDRIVLRSSSD
jgi:predicted RNA-binding protein (virulence factor B family)